MSPVYRIAKWSEVYETADSRRYKTLTWVSVPVGFQSSGYQSLVEDEPDDAAEIFGAWIALVSIAAQCPERGVLASSRGKAITARRAAQLSYLPAETFEKVFAWASQEHVGWLEVKETHGTHPSDGQPENGRQTTVSQPPVVSDPGYLTKPNLTKPEASASCSVEPSEPDPKPAKRSRKAAGEPQGFAEWYAAYPRREGRAKAALAYAKASRIVSSRQPDAIAFLLERATAFAASDVAKGERRFIPHPATWLNQGRYDDDPACWSRSADQARAGPGGDASRPQNQSLSEALKSV